MNDLLLGLNLIDVSVVRSGLLIHAQRNKGMLVLDDLLIHFRQVYHNPQDVRYFLSQQGDGWFVPHGVWVWRAKHPPTGGGDRGMKGQGVPYALDTQSRLADPTTVERSEPCFCLECGEQVELGLSHSKLPNRLSVEFNSLRQL